MTQKLRPFVLILGDYALFFAALLATLLIVRPAENNQYHLALHMQIFSFVFLLWLLMFYVEGLYSLTTTMLKSLLISLMRALVLSVLFSIIIFYLFHNDAITPKRNLVVIATLSGVLSWCWHTLFRRITSSRKFLTRVALFGEEKSVALVSSELERKPYLGFSVKQTLNNVSELKMDQVDLIVVGRSVLKDGQVSNRLLEALDNDKSIMEMGKFTELVSGKIPLTAIDETWFLEACGMQMSSLSILIKNTFDKMIALLLTLIVLPIYAILIPILLLVSGRPIFFTQTRTGHLNTPFKLWKLRTMVVDAEKDGAQWSRPGDSRITPIGRFLRMTRLDELPQLWNILNGDMSIVGPRPERPEIISEKLAPIIPFYNQRHLVKPGVTGWAQVNFRYGYSQDDSLEKLQFDLFYVKNQSFWLDLRILLKTVKTILTGAGQ